MNLAEFLDARRPAWQELDRLLARAEAREVSDLGHERARRLVDLYRRASADLVQARTYGAGLGVTRYLEALNRTQLRQLTDGSARPRLVEKGRRR